MTKRIFKAVCLATLSVFLVTMLLILGTLYDYFTTIQQKQLKVETVLAAQGVEQSGLAYFEGLNDSDYRITWISSDGRVLFDSSSDSIAMENHLQREEVQEALTDGFGESIRYSSTLTQRSMYCADRLSDGSIIRLSVSHNSIFLLLLGMYHPIFIIVTTALVLAFVLANQISKRIVKPLNHLNLDSPLSNDGYDELSPLLTRISRQQRELQVMSRELKTKEKELEKLESLRREFTANVSHELKTPLHAISGYSELIKCGIAKPEDVQPFGTKIYEETQRLITLVEDIINLSHLDEGGKDYIRTQVDLYDCAAKVIERLSAFAAESHVELKLEGEHCPIQGVPELIHGILYNLCDNAIKYNQIGGSVCITIADNKLSVKDTGIGIPKEHVERVFERFYRVDKSRSKEVGGTGLGLSIVKHAAMIHQAHIDVESTVGVGTTISVSFPDTAR